MLHEIGQAKVNGVPVEVHAPDRGEALGHVVGRLVGEEPAHPAGEEAHDRQGARRLIVDGIPKRPERLAPAGWNEPSAMPDTVAVRGDSLSAAA